MAVTGVLEEWQPRLRALAVPDLRLVDVDPRAAAVTGLLVADYVGQPDMANRLRALDGVSGFSAAHPAELGALGRVVLSILDRLGGDFLPPAATIPEELVRRASDLRAAMTENVERTLPGSADVRLSLDAIRRTSGPVDLVYDLRTLANLYQEHHDAIAQDADLAARTARAEADEVERALREGEIAEESESRDLMTRAWTLFVRTYVEVCEAGRFITRGKGRERNFPPLAMIAAHSRAKRRPTSLVPPEMRAPVPPRAPPPIPPRPAPPMAAPPPIPAPPMAAPPAISATPVSAPPTISAPSAPPLPVSPGVDASPLVEPTPPPFAAPGASQPPAPISENGRRSPRHRVEIEVNVHSESNFYLGFAENLSEGGVFIATYCPRPIGSNVEVELELASGERLTLLGVVRWLRMDSCNDGWPGMGIQFTNLEHAELERIRQFMATREPLFYPL